MDETLPALGRTSTAGKSAKHVAPRPPLRLNSLIRGQVPANFRLKKL